MTALEITSIAISLIGGLAIFLYGMKVMTESLTLVAGRRMKLLLSKLTRNRFTAALAGAMVTAIIQSSSVTTVLIVSFITAGLMSFTQSIGMILGANVGTTITAQIIAFKVTKAAMLMIAFGFFTELLASNRRVKYLATMMLGLGLLFLGMNLMSQATEPLKSLPSFIALMRDIQNPLAGILIGATFTALVQSSSATTGIIIILASQGFISLEAGIALVMGANIGTCVTAILSAIGKPREAVQAAVVHVVFNVLGVLLWVWFIPQLAHLVQEISPSSPQLQGAARLAADAPRQIANAHTLFNVINLFIFIGFTGVLARIVEWLVPVETKSEIPPATPRYIDDYYLDEPSMALDRTRLELERLGNYTLEMVKDSLPALAMGTHDRIHSLQHRNAETNALHDAIVRYLGKLSTQNLINPQPQRLYRYIGAANYLENISDVVETSIVEASLQRMQQDLHISPETLNQLKTLHDSLCNIGQLTLEALIENDLEKAEAANNSKASFNQLIEQTRRHLSKRLTIDTPQHLATYRLENHVIESFKHIHSLYRRIAKLILSEKSDQATGKGKTAEGSDSDKKEHGET